MSMLGAANPSDPTNAEAWGTYLTALRSSLQTSWGKAKNSYLTLKKVRAGLGLPFVSAGGGGESGGGVAASDEGSWSDSLESNILDLQAMVKVNDDALGDAIAGKRKLYYDVQSNDFAIEGLPGDLIRVRLSPEGYLSLVNAQGQTTHVGGTVGAIPLLVFGAVAATAVAGAVTFVGAALVVMKTCDAISTIAEQKTMQTIAIKQAELVQSGKATPAQAAALTQGLYTGAENLAKAKAEAKKEEPTSKLASTITTVAYVGLGLGVLYLVAQMVPRGGMGRTAAAYSENPGRIRFVRNRGEFAGGSEMGERVPIGWVVEGDAHYPVYSRYEADDLVRELQERRRTRRSGRYQENPPRVMSGYAFTTGKTKGLRGKDWMYARDEDWEHTLVDEGYGYRFLGTRIIDGTKMFVWSEPSKQRYVAQTASSWLQGTHT